MGDVDDHEKKPQIAQDGRKVLFRFWIDQQKCHRIIRTPALKSLIDFRTPPSWPRTSHRSPTNVILFTEEVNILTPPPHVKERAMLGCSPRSSDDAPGCFLMLKLHLIVARQVE